MEQTDLLILRFSMISSDFWYENSVCSPLEQIPLKKIDSLSNQQSQACSTQIKFTEIEQTSPIHMDDWINQ